MLCEITIWTSLTFLKALEVRAHIIFHSLVVSESQVLSKCQLNQNRRD